MSGEFLTSVHALDLALRAADTYHPPKCHEVRVDRTRGEAVIVAMREITAACIHTDEQIIDEWRAAVAAAGVIL